MIQRFKYKLPAILYAALIFYLSSIPKEEMPKLPMLRFDKLIHLVEYAVFGIFLMMAFKSSGNARIRMKADFHTAWFGILYGMSDEIHQFFVPGRNTSALDLIADSLGILLGIYLFNRLKVFDRFRNYEFDRATD